ncbi:MAG: hypothetical protein JJU31_08830 [Wenzhouxiangella sp.]|nr:hypothetical protein [Wenzhouxiangella sp.]MCH8477228.1 hypothetical protein [Wenzhouxiangella sp.]
MSKAMNPRAAVKSVHVENLKLLREAHPYAANAWVDREILGEQEGSSDIVRHDINFSLGFLQHQPRRPLHEIGRELVKMENPILVMPREVTG